MKENISKYLYSSFYFVDELSKPYFFSVFFWCNLHKDPITYNQI
ncbi:hypothetical protein J658_3504 [Acinetobacter baumannii 573719]|nr:hypothetical protein J658_3504 [Acinetobacter baumannii 573719]